MNYAAYRVGELKALWEWLQSTGIKLATLGVHGPLDDNASEAMELDVPTEHDWHHQSVGFVVIEKPPRLPLPWKVLADSEAQKAVHTSPQQLTLQVGPRMSQEPLLDVLSKRPA